MDYLVSERTVKNGNKEIFGEAYIPVSEKKLPIVIFSHGYNGRYFDFRRITEYLAKRGIASYGFDFCGGSAYSKSSLKTTEMTIYTEISDLESIINDVSSWSEIDSENIFIFGGSQGGLVSSLTAERNIEKIKGMLLLFPAFCIADNWRDNFKTVEEIPETVELWGNTLGREFFTTIRDLYIFDEIGKYDKNVLIFHGDQDAIVNIELGKKASKIYKNAEIIEFPGEGHGFTPAGEIKVAEYTYKFVIENKGN